MMEREREGEGKTVNECFHCTIVRGGGGRCSSKKKLKATHIPRTRVTTKKKNSSLELQLWDFFLLPKCTTNPGNQKRAPTGQELPFGHTVADG